MLKSLLQEHIQSLSVTDSSGNIAEEDVSIIVVASDLFSLSAEDLEVLAGLASLFSIMPEEIPIGEIGVFHQTIEGIGTAGNRYMEDEEIIQYALLNQITAPEYIEIINTYHGSLSTMHSYLATVLPLLASITKFEKEYTAGGLTFSMVKVADTQYQIEITGTVMDQVVTFEIVIDSFTLLDEYLYAIQFDTEYAAWH